MRHAEFSHEFVDAMPETLAEGRLYVSIRYRTASHLCACGCGSKIVTPIRPAKWKLTFDGDTVSLSPSIGNWQQACRSHYWIRNNRIIWAKTWSDEEIDAGRKQDAYQQREYYQLRSATNEPPQQTSEEGAPRHTIFVRLHQFFKRR